MRHDLQSAQFRFLQFTEILLPEILDTQYNKRKIILYKNKKEKPIKLLVRKKQTVLLLQMQQPSQQKCQVL